MWYNQILSSLLNADLCNSLQFNILTSLHPSPAVCGLPTEEARRFIKENGMYLTFSYVSIAMPLEMF